MVSGCQFFTVLQNYYWKGKRAERQTLGLGTYSFRAIWFPTVRIFCGLIHRDPNRDGVDLGHATRAISFSLNETRDIKL